MYLERVRRVGVLLFRVWVIFSVNVILRFSFVSRFLREEYRVWVVIGCCVLGVVRWIKSLVNFMFFGFFRL